MMKDKIPNCQMKASPHINLRMKILRGKCHAITEIHPNAVGLRNKPFSFYDELDYIHGKDKATRECAENPTNAIKIFIWRSKNNKAIMNHLPYQLSLEVGSEQEEISPTTTNPSTHAAHTTYVDYQVMEIK
ncbi:hypothetical protein P3X46_022593 [Hevea brasiliensis]|uniref:Uncharacterized protein n=1 Tax=Hevea brasiliensis TaxID=3981 RepID=A0ABQ9L8D4_HEVBR|nr:hypothetical protein P3X46_022593 [Hevea brasiliensis]